MSSDSVTADVLVDRILARAKSLYALPAATAEVFRVLEREPLDVISLRSALSCDAVLTGRILQFANSAYFGFRGAVADVPQAVALLGPALIRSAILSASLPPTLVTGVDPAFMARFWRQTIYRAVAARRFAQSLWNVESEPVFLAALLQGLGSLVLFNELGTLYSQFLEHVYAQHKDPADDEVAVFGFSHAMISARLLQSWGLPEAITKLVDPAGESSAVDVEKSQREVSKMATIAAYYLVTKEPSALLHTLDHARQFPHVSREALRAALDDLEVEAKSLAPLFSVDLSRDGQSAATIAGANSGSDAEKTCVSPIPEPEEAVLKSVDELRGELRHLVQTSRQHRKAVEPPPPPAEQMPGDGSTFRSVGVSEKLAAAIVRARNRRQSLSIVLLALDQPQTILTRGGRKVLDRFNRWLEKTVSQFLDEPEQVIAMGDAELVIALEGYDRAEAVNVARHCVQLVRNWPVRGGEHWKMNAGVASVVLPSRNFQPNDLLQSALRCLQAAQSSGGDTVKSIEV